MLRLHSVPLWEVLGYPSWCKLVEADAEANEGGAEDAAARLSQQFTTAVVLLTRFLAWHLH